VLGGSLGEFYENGVQFGSVVPHRLRYKCLFEEEKNQNDISHFGNPKKIFLAQKNKANVGEEK